MKAQFTIKIYLGNEAMRVTDDVAEALRRVADKLERGTTEGSIRDVNGNTVGAFVGAFEGES